MIKNHIILEILSSKTLDLNATQNKLSIPIINRIYKKMKFGLKFDAIKVYNNMIIDGHHRYISSVLANIELERVTSSKTIATIEYNWGDVEFVSEEWDTKEKINRLNEQDALFNNLTLEKIIEITK
jgi:hypothetical protein